MISSNIYLRLTRLMAAILLLSNGPAVRAILITEYSANAHDLYLGWSNSATPTGVNGASILSSAGADISGVGWQTQTHHALIDEEWIVQARHLPRSGVCHFFSPVLGARVTYYLSPSEAVIIRDSNTGQFTDIRVRRVYRDAAYTIPGIDPAHGIKVYTIHDGPQVPGDRIYPIGFANSSGSLSPRVGNEFVDNVNFGGQVNNTTVYGFVNFGETGGAEVIGGDSGSPTLVVDAFGETVIAGIHHATGTINVNGTDYPIGIDSDLGAYRQEIEEAIGAEIKVEESTGADVVDGAGSYSLGTAEVGTSAGSKVFTIRNTGWKPLNGIAAVVTGMDAGDFTVSAPGATTLQRNESTTVTVSFVPGAVGSRSATLQIASNDADENPFDVSLTGTGTAPPSPSTPAEIVVEQPAGTDLADGNASLAFGSADVGTAGGSLTVTIRNTGDLDLTGLDATVTGAQASDFTASAPASTTLASGQSTTFTVSFAPGASGARNAALQIASNDADEDPFDISLSGTGTTPPMPAEIVVEQPAGTGLADGNASLAFGSADVGTSGGTRTVTIRNTGDLALTGLATSVTGASASDFTATAPASTSLASGQSTTFTVSFVPGAAGARGAALQIASNDSDENPFDISLSGTGTTPPTAAEIVVEQPVGTGLADGSSSLAFGSAEVGASGGSRTVTIRNTGDLALTGLATSVTGAGASDFTATAPASTSLASGQSTTFTVSFVPGAAGARGAALQIASNDSDENPFDISLSGTGVPVDDHGGDQSSATEVTSAITSGAALPPASGMGTSGSIDTSGDEDWFQFTVTETALATIQTTGAMDTFGHLHDASGAQLASDDNSGTGVNFKMEEELFPGTYAVRVRGAAGSTTGAYELHVNLDSGSSSDARKDFDGDGYPDILWRRSTGETAIHFYQEENFLRGRYTTQQVTPAASVAGIGDFDGNGKADLLWKSSGGTSIHFMDGETYLAPGQWTTQQVSAPWEPVGVGDFDGDGRADILYQNSNNRMMAIHYMNAQFVTSQKSTYAVSWEIKGVADFNGDGMADLLLRNPTTLVAAYHYLNDGDFAGAAAPSQQVKSTAWDLMGADDFDGNGSSDLLWRNNMNGRSVIHYYDGVSYQRGRWISSQVTNLSWSPILK